MTNKVDPKATGMGVLTFTLGEQYYALPIAAVIEVAAMVELISVVTAKPEVIGAANRHGTVLPMLDLRQVMKSATSTIDDNTLFIVADGGDGAVGLVVDQVLQVEYLDSSQLRKAGAGDFVMGMITHDNHMIQVLDLPTILRKYVSDSLTVEGS